MNSESVISYNKGSTSFVGPDAVEIYRLTVIRSALLLYAKTGIKANRAYTPTNMLAAVLEATGEKFPRTKRGYFEASQALSERINELRDKVRVEVEK